MIKYSKQREAIKKILNEKICDHPTAEEVYLCLRQDYPSVSLGTVYRNLTLLSQLGEILRIPCGDGADRYEGKAEPHYHFLCERCGKVSDLAMTFSQDIYREVDIQAQKNFGGIIHRHDTFFYGICSGCLEADERS